MRIVAGTAGGRQIATPDGDDVRPTKDRVREAVFNSLNSYQLVEGQRFLDMFAGSGALGLEALSRGAASCTFVDKDRHAVEVVRENIERLGFGDRAVVRQGDISTMLPAIEAHDVALLDPPYSFDGWSDLLAVVPSTTVVLESDRPVAPGPQWRILKEKRYAGTVVVIAQQVEGGSEPVEETEARS